MMYLIYVLVSLTGGVLIGMAGLTAAMIITPILAGICGWNEKVMSRCAGVVLLLVSILSIVLG